MKFWRTWTHLSVHDRGSGPWEWILVANLVPCLFLNQPCISRLNQRTPFCTNALSICRNVGLLMVEGIEVSHRYRVSCVDLKKHESEIVELLHDRMTQCRWEQLLWLLPTHFSWQTLFFSVTVELYKMLEESYSVSQWKYAYAYSGHMIKMLILIWWKTFSFLACLLAWLDKCKNLQQFFRNCRCWCFCKLCALIWCVWR